MINGHPLEPGDGITASTTAGTLNCCICTDSFAQGKIKAHQVQPAFTIAPHLQVLGPGQVALIAIPMCLDCRKQQLGVGGLIIA